MQLFTRLWWNFFECMKFHRILHLFIDIIWYQMKFYKIKKPVNQGFTGFSVPIIGLSAEKEGFEPPEVWPSLVFKTSAFDHSAISPRVYLIAQMRAQI